MARQDFQPRNKCYEVSFATTADRQVSHHRPGPALAGRGLSLAEVRGRVFDARVNAKNVEL